jgi:hypothetical protein
VPFNNFDALLSDLAAVQRLKDSGHLQKALAQADGARIAKAFPSVAEMRKQSRRPAAQPIMLQQLAPTPKPRTSRAPTKAQVRAKFEKAAPQILQKAMSLFAEGKIDAVDVARIEARIHHMDLATR